MDIFTIQDPITYTNMKKKKKNLKYIFVKSICFPFLFFKVRTITTTIQVTD